MGYSEGPPKRCVKGQGKQRQSTAAVSLMVGSCFAHRAGFSSEQRRNAPSPPGAEKRQSTVEK